MTAILRGNEILVDADLLPCVETIGFDGYLIKKWCLNINSEKC